MITYVTSPKKAEEVVRDVGSGRALAVQADCAMAAASASKVIAATVERFGDRIDIVVNNAANGTDQTLEQVDTDVFNTMFHTNVLFPLLLIKEATTYLGRQARIVNISSAGARACK